jgi:hypothetical protein
MEISRQLKVTLAAVFSILLLISTGGYFIYSFWFAPENERTTPGEAGRWFFQVLIVLIVSELIQRIRARRRKGH